MHLHNIMKVNYCLCKSKSYTKTKNGGVSDDAPGVLRDFNSQKHPITLTKAPKQHLLQAVEPESAVDLEYRVKKGK